MRVEAEVGLPLTKYVFSDNYVQGEFNMIPLMNFTYLRKHSKEIENISNCNIL